MASFEHSSPPLHPQQLDASSASPDSASDDVSGFVYMPPGWDEGRLRAGAEADAIAKIALDTFTDIAYIKDKNAIQIIGETHDEVYAAQTKLNDIFFPVIVRSKKQWARPDRPGSWGQRRDSVAAPAGSALRKMNSDLSLRNNYGNPAGNGGWQGQAMQQQQQQQYQQPWSQQQQAQNQPPPNYYQSDQRSAQARHLNQRNSASEFNKRNSYNNFGNEQPISPASPFARW
ncbi:hypothetical protein CcCBS67573_g08032 [Chytriomyces confervae]|uniref:Uncharacterized protein n=1 Tax=Chytriomyces confervae TaxID=246404 RepID=A0A507ER26_9FUNG|nr:hypothetical protein HDU80_003534 [Chytriomyces hyalinus]TPX65787.1 hypothetical protein CcCBS67573_g08032 [Chytriomyces confervae]